MECNELLRRLTVAFHVFGVRDRELFFDAPLERPALTRLALHCQYLFPEYDVDCEYGRYEDHPKQVALTEYTLQKVKEQNLDAQYTKWIAKAAAQSKKDIVPDLVIHKRRKQFANLLFVEAKPTDKPWDWEDSVKLCLVTSGIEVRTGALKYEYGLQLNMNLNLGQKGHASARLWKDGSVARTITFPYAV